jgi:hypothetical protein
VVTIAVERLDGRPPLTIERSELVAEVFFRLDQSSRPGGYDEYILANSPWSDRIVEADISTINRTMRARSRPSAWTELIEAGHLDWLDALGRDWDLLAFDDAAWRDRGCPEAFATAFDGIKGRYRGRAVSTKLLHLKRPALVPVCDSFVEWQVGAPSSIDSVTLVEYIRSQGRQNLAELLAVQSYLARRGIHRTLVRVFDALLWSTHPASELGPVADLIRDWTTSGIITP